MLAAADASLVARLTKKRKVQHADLHLTAFVDNFTVAELNEIDKWVYEHAEKDGIIMTHADLLAHLSAAYGVDGKRPDARQLLQYLRYEYGDIKNGYYYAKANKPESVNHRRRLLPLLAFVMVRVDLFVFACQDEKPFRMFHNPQKKHKKIGNVEHGMDKGATTTTGPGYDMSTAMTLQGVVTTEAGTPVGYLLDTTKKATGAVARRTKEMGVGKGKGTKSSKDKKLVSAANASAPSAPAASAKAAAASRASGRSKKPSAKAQAGAEQADHVQPAECDIPVTKASAAAQKAKASNEAKVDSSTFLAVIEASCIELKRIYKDKVPVILIDAPRTHTTYAESSPLYGGLSSWTVKNTEKSSGRNYTNWFGEEFVKGRTKEELYEHVRTCAWYLQHPMAVEAVAQKHGCVVIFNCNSTPQFNPIEKLWRLVSARWSAVPRAERQMSTFLAHILEYTSTPERLHEVSKNGPKVQKLSHVSKWYHVARQFMRWSIAHGGSAKFPTEKQVVNMDLPDIHFAQWTEIFCSGGASKELVKKNSKTFLLFVEAVHMLNMYRKTPCKGDIWTSEVAKKLKI